ncbi:MAG: PAS domain-containing protein [Deltaproteobacteria bacterium]|nr:PAS domain-containing protein [Deltaproteobacteria bacterium]
MKNKNSPSGRKFSILLWVVALSLAPLFVPTVSLAADPGGKDLQTVVAVIPSDFPPTYFRDPKDGKPNGLAVDVMNELAKRAGLRVEYRFGEPWDEIEDILLTGQADLIPFRAINDRTKQRFIFTRTLDTFQVNYIARASDVSTIGPAPGKKVGVIKGSTAHEKLKENRDLLVISYPKMQHLLMDLLTGQIDLIMTTTENLLKLAGAAGMREKVRVITPPAFEVLRSIALRPGSKTIRDLLDNAIESFENDTEQRQIYERWIGKPEPWWTVGRVLIASGGCSALVLLALLIWRFVGIHRLNRTLDADRVFLQTMIDAIPEPIFFKNRDSVYIGCNDFFASAFIGLPKERIIGRTDVDIIKDMALAEFFRQRDRETIVAGKPIKNDKWIKLVDGRSILAETITTPFRDESGEIAGLIGIARDVTERNMAEQIQAFAHRRLQTFLDNLPMLAWLKDCEGRFEMVNEAFAKACGRGVEDVIGKTDQDVWPLEFAEIYRTDDVQAISSGQKLQVEEQVVIGTEMRWFMTFKTPILTEQGKVTGTAGIAQDITERRLDREALQESEARYRALSHEFKTVLESIPDAISIISADKRIIWANQKAVETMKAKETYTEGEYCYKAQLMRRAPCESCPLHTVLESGKPNEFIISRDNETWEYRLIPINDDSKKITKILRLGRNVTQTKKLEAQLREAQKLEAIGTLAGGIAHDFNNILSPIIGYTEMVLEDMHESEALRHDLGQVLTAAHRARNLVRQILAFSRMGQEQPMTGIDISTIVKEALKLLRASLPSTIEIRQNLEKGVSVVDATQIHQVIVNLCTNAAHAMEDKGVLDVSLTRVHLGKSDLNSFPISSNFKPGPYLKLCVSDTGHGIGGETIQRIFEPYFTTKEVGKGTGLGLAVVHGIIKRHGGEIVVRSEPGKGSVFDVYLPRAVVESTASIAMLEASPRGSGNILLVDDEQMLVDMGSRMLKKLGYQVTTKTSALDALDLFRSRPQEFDLVITDYTMPGLTGIELAREILQVRPDIPVILCTGFNKKVTEETAKELGIKALIMKPLERRQLAKLIRSVLGV